KLRSFVDEVMSNAPQLPSHIKHSQWEYHWADFQDARRLPGRIRSWGKTRLQHAVTMATPVTRLTRRAFQKTFGAALRVSETFATHVKRKAVEVCKPFVRIVGNRYLRPALRRLGLEIVKSTSLFAVQKKANEATHEANLRAKEAALKAKAVTRLKRQRQADRVSITRLKEKITDLGDIASEYQLKLERSPDYQALMAQDQLRAGMSNLEPEFLALYEQCRQYTMTSWERLYAFYKSVKSTVENRIPGDLVECGVWRGGSMKLVAPLLHSLGDTSRTLFLYDTFEGMTEPDPTVDIDFSGNPAANDWREVQRRGVKWAYAPVEEVYGILATSGYPMEKVKLVKGPVEETIPGIIPASIAILRLD